MDEEEEIVEMDEGKKTGLDSSVVEIGVSTVVDTTDNFEDSFVDLTPGDNFESGGKVMLVCVMEGVIVE